MRRVFKKSAQIALTLLFATSVANAIDAEYKNSLMKVEFNKTSDSSYSINLYTQKNFQEPVKVIKKSDLNYYILLPETSNSSASSISSPDIRSVTTKVYPYAGADINNGYTKIDINTTKPINFSVSTKSSVSQKPAKPPVSNPPVEEVNKVVEKKIEKKPEPKAQPKQEIKKETKVEEKKQPETKVREKIVKEEAKKITPPINNMPVLKPELDDFEEEIITEKIVAQEVDNKEALEPNIVEETPFEQEYSNSFEEKFFFYKNKIAKKLKSYGLGLDDILLMCLAALATFIVMLIVLSRKPSSAKLQNKADLIDKTQEGAQHFVFDDKNQNKPSKRNFALSSYAPQKSSNYEYKKPEPKIEPEESVIIQKILEEDSYSKISPEEFITPYNTKPPVQPTVQEQPRPAEPKIVTEPEPIEEPVVLSSIEIAPQRGFMCVSYNGNISFVGYILDDVFALYNFKQPELDDYNIKFRLSEKTEKGANFIVKVDKVKLLVGVTKSSMTLEVAM